MGTTIDASLERTNELLKEKMLQWLPKQDRISTLIDGLMLSRKDETDKMESCFYHPVIGVVVQGAKRSLIGNSEYRYGQYQYMIAGVDMPSINHMTDASPEKPFLALSIKLDRYLITKLTAEIFSELPPEKELFDSNPEGVLLGKVSHELLDAFLRLVQLLDHPSRIPVLAPMIIREIHYLLLTSSQGECLRAICTFGTQANRIAQAISWLRDNYKEPLNIEELAKRVYMAPSSFHRHFRRVTTISPLQFQKRLRLYEAERLMLVENKDALTAALEVGYGSATQFNREYKRQFGEPPFRNVSKKRSLEVTPFI